MRNEQLCLIRALSSDGPDAVARKFPYRLPHVSVFSRGGGGVRSSWYLAYVCPIKGRRICRAISPDVEETAREAKRISQQIDAAKTGRLDRRQLDAEERERRELLGGWILGRFVPGHLEDYRDWLLARNREPKYVRDTYRSIRKVFRLCQFRTLADVEGAVLETRVAEILRDKRGRSLRTCNQYLKAASAFTSWLAKPKVGRARYNPLSDVELYNESVDRRRERRAVEIADFMRVIQLVRKSDPVLGMSGEDRAMFYLLKLQTGFRNPEVASLTPLSFHLLGDRPFIRVEAAFSKHRRQDDQLITVTFAREVGRWLDGKAQGQPVLRLPDKPCRMWRRDLEAAGVPYKTDRGYADLHALRHTFGTELGRSGASIKTVQDLMRHSDIKMTQRYMHSTSYDQQAALASLPGFPCGEAQRTPPTAATGTDSTVSLPRQAESTIQPPNPLKMRSL